MSAGMVTILQNAASVFPDVQTMMGDIVAMMGVYFGIFGLVKMKAYARNPDEGKMGIKMVALGGFFIDASFYVNAASNTLFSNVTPLTAAAYGSPSGAAPLVMGEVALGIIILLGWWSCYRGIHYLMLSSKNQPTVSRGITHLVGGSIAVNWIVFVTTVFSWLGMNTALLTQLGWT